MMCSPTSDESGSFFGSHKYDPLNVRREGDSDKGSRPAGNSMKSLLMTQMVELTSEA